jgi:hypothetical protein
MQALSHLGSRKTAVRLSSSALLLMAVCWSNAALCQDDNGLLAKKRPPLLEYIQEFFLSDAVRCQEQGELQLTVGVDSRQQLGTGMAARTEYGLTNRLQLGLEVPYGRSEGKRSDTTPGWTTASLGVQYQIIRSTVPFALTAGMTFEVPVESGGELEYEPTVLAAKSFRSLQIHASFVAEIGRAEKPSFQYNLASVYPVRQRWFPTLEFNGRQLHGKNATYITPGMYRHFRHRIEVGVGVPLGISGTASRAGVVSKVSWELGGEREPD